MRHEVPTATPTHGGRRYRINNLLASSRRRGRCLRRHLRGRPNPCRHQSLWPAKYGRKRAGVDIFALLLLRTRWVRCGHLRHPWRSVDGRRSHGHSPAVTEQQARRLRERSRRVPVRTRRALNRITWTRSQWGALGRAHGLAFGTTLRKSGACLVIQPLGRGSNACSVLARPVNRCFMKGAVNAGFRRPS